MHGVQGGVFIRDWGKKLSAPIKDAHFVGTMYCDLSQNLGVTAMCGKQGTLWVSITCTLGSLFC